MVNPGQGEGVGARSPEAPLSERHEREATSDPECDLEVTLRFHIAGSAKSQDIIPALCGCKNICLRMCATRETKQT